MMDTPCYVIDLDRVCANWFSLQEAICPEKLYYAMKCNSDPNILKVIADLPGGRFEVASDGEMERIVGLGVDAGRVICSTPVKPLRMLERLSRLGCGYFVFDTYSEFRKIKDLAPYSKKIVRIDITGVVSDTIPFGMSVAELRRLIDSGCVDANEINGVTFYISANNDLSKVLSALGMVESVVRMLPRGMIVNLGGNYRLPEEVDAMYYVGLRKKMAELRVRFGCVFYAEPGRSVVKSACSLLSQVVCVKDRGDCCWVYLDAGVPTGISYKPPRIEVAGGTEIVEVRHYRFFDTTCSHRELFDASLEIDIRVGNILVMRSVGSYYLSKVSNFHGWRLPNVVCERGAVLHALSVV